tara:strand:- start:869 stop:1036 length:168 start_codon:yes stop_codon:yes gene_type:complete
VVSVTSKTSEFVTKVSSGALKRTGRIPELFITTPVRSERFTARRSRVSFEIFICS